ncbi:hypothetical protein PTD2_18675 [Pseudoalteromonas tunicata D2]|jgi:hypothetical protein|uniref:Uncharacterized protein n=1 Tax=Pseudoalteromonas tunicata D2 TaxID=87626 RepID=A4CBY8_9GAMM|nr:hypothetical protein PTD2_18675 [Pseudoalteromonas tunicata D2]
MTNVVGVTIFNDNKGDPDWCNRYALNRINHGAITK